METKTDTKGGKNVIALAGIAILAILAILVIFGGGEDKIGVSDVAGGNQPSVAVQQNQQNVPGVGAIAPDTQTQIQQTETQTDKGIAVKTGEIVKTGKVLTPSEETAEKFLIAMSEERYSDAKQYVDTDYMNKLGVFGGKTEEETLYIITRRLMVFFNPNTGKTEMLENTRYSTKEIWSAKDNRPIEYKIAIVDFNVYVGKSVYRRDIDLIKKKGTWKIIDIGGL